MSAMGACATCKWAVFEFTKHKKPRIKPDHHGQCNYPIPDPVLPLAVTLAYGYYPVRKGIIFPDWKDCPTWEAK